MLTVHNLPTDSNRILQRIHQLTADNNNNNMTTDYGNRAKQTEVKNLIKHMNKPFLKYEYI